MFCRMCGSEIEYGINFCPKCGAAQNDSIRPSIKNRNPNESERSRLIACLLAFFVGGLGIHRFYVGKIGTGILQILLTCCFGIGYIWALIDFILIVCGNFKDIDGKYLTNWEIV